MAKRASSPHPCGFYRVYRGLHFNEALGRAVAEAEGLGYTDLVVDMNRSRENTTEQRWKEEEAYVFIALRGNKPKGGTE